MCNFYTVNLNFFNFLLLPAVVAGMPAVTALQFRKGARCHRQPLQVARLVPGSAAVGCAHSPDVVGSINSQEEQFARPKKMILPSMLTAPPNPQHCKGPYSKKFAVSCVLERKLSIDMTCVAM
jgi:hypothetical protein